MGKRLDTITANTKDVNEIQQALAHVGIAASERLPATHTARPTPPRRRTTSGPSLAFTPMVKLRPSKTLDLPVALQEALLQAGIPFNQESIEGLQDTLIRAQIEREQKLHEHYSSTSTSTRGRIAERSNRADSDWRVIHDALYKHTPFQQVHLSNPKLEKQLKSMERELEERDRELLEAEGNELSLSDPKVRAFIAKYGR